MKYALVPTLLATAYAGFQVESKRKGEDFNDAPHIPTGEELPEIEHPAFVPFDASQLKSAVLFEQFDGSEASLFENWKISHAKKTITDEKEEFSFTGKWAVEEASIFPGFAGDQGLVLKSDAQHHGISRKFAEPLDNKDNTLVVQYEVKFQKGLNCGGAYVKLLSESPQLATEEFSNATPYQVMFGPDKCGSNDKTHFIIQRKNPHTGEYEEKHLVVPPRTQTGKLTTLYTLIITPDQEYEIRINGEVRKAGSLLHEGAFKPALNPPKEVPDLNEVKPADWVEEEMIPDPNETEKPEDWDEDAPLKIADPEAVIPADWREDLEDYVADPEAVKPEEWDDEEDGEWVAPLVPNPECSAISGCGPWTAPLIKNPGYKGKWLQPLVPNPDYKGEWEPQLIPNPAYYEDNRPSDLEPIGGLGFELWTMQADILFDNIYVGHSIEDAELLGNATYKPKFEVEQLEYNAKVPVPETKNKDQVELKQYLDWFLQDPLLFVQGAYSLFVPAFRKDPVSAITAQPVAAGVVIFSFILLSSVLFGVVNVLLSFFTKKQLPPIERKKAQAKLEAAQAKAEAAVPEASTSAAEVADTKARKRV